MYFNILVAKTHIWGYSPNMQEYSIINTTQPGHSLQEKTQTHILPLILNWSSSVKNVLGSLLESSTAVSA